MHTKYYVHPANTLFTSALRSRSKNRNAIPIPVWLAAMQIHLTSPKQLQHKIFQWFVVEYMQCLLIHNSSISEVWLM